jgi:hypothetical protein
MDGTFSDFWEVRNCCPSIALSMPPIPKHKPSGVLPPFLGKEPGESSLLMSPYPSTPAEFVSKLGTSAQRRRILRGYLDHREALRALGITRGIQWLCGSFVEAMSREPNDIDVVTFYSAPTNWNEDETSDANQSVFVPKLAKIKYHCDTYFVCIAGNSDVPHEDNLRFASRLRPVRQNHRSVPTGNIIADHTSMTGLSRHPHLTSKENNKADETPAYDRAALLLRITSFWLGLFSHQRESFTWKGIVSVQLESDDGDRGAREMIEIMEQFAPGGDA